MGDVSVPIVIPAFRCANCQTPIIDRGWAKVHHRGMLTEIGVPAQLRRAGVRFDAGIYTGAHLCDECANAAAGHFVCSLCHERRTSDQMHDQWGALPEYVCTPCYETVPAKQYEEFVAAMEEEHRYDFE